jgi:hypothetical protein
MTGVRDVTVAIPVRDGGMLLERTLASPALARAHGARVIEIPAAQFSHGGTRNLLMREARGAYVALLTQDAEPASERWLEELLAGFQLAGDVGIVFGPYLPRPAASPSVRRELQGWFASLAPDGRPRAERLNERERALPAEQLVRRNDWELVGRRGFFSDVNAAIARGAWQRAPFREVAYAEDRLLALDMLRAGYAKAYVPSAGVLHSHDYTTVQQLQRAFDEWRGLREIYGWRQPLAPRRLLGELRSGGGASKGVGSDSESESGDSESGGGASKGVGSDSESESGDSESGGGDSPGRLSRHNVARLSGALLGSRAERLPPRLRRALSLEGRAGFTPVDLDAQRPEVEAPGVEAPGVEAPGVEAPGVEAPGVEAPGVEAPWRA